jgi:hypothetical protein
VCVAVRVEGGDEGAAVGKNYLLEHLATSFDDAYCNYECDSHGC